MVLTLQSKIPAPTFGWPSQLNVLIQY